MLSFKIVFRVLSAAALLALLCQATPAADEPVWQAMLGDLPKNEKAGSFGLCGICVDHASGDVFINISDKGFYRSTDGAKTFQRISDTQPKGRTEEPGCFLIDPTGKSKKLVTALVYGAPISVSTDSGATWKMMNGKSAHVDWCAVDWTDPEMKFVLALLHEKGGLLIASQDGGKSFTEVGKTYGTGWIFDNQTAVVAEAKTKDRPKPNLVRTTDGGKTWKPCGEYSPVGVNSAQALPKLFDGTLYWLVDGSLIATADKGQNWKKVCDLKDGRYGPIFGKDAKHMFVLTGPGIVETTDGGATWSKPIAAPKDLKGVGGLTWLEYDPRSDSLYLMKMASDLYKLSRGK
jgi:BNR/Asp-box repeat protein